MLYDYLESPISQSSFAVKNKNYHMQLWCQTDLKVSPSEGGGKCEVSVRATGPGLEEEALPGRPSSGSESGGAGLGFLTQILPRTERGKTCGLEHEHALRELAAGIAPPCWGCRVCLIWLDRDLSFQDLKEEKKEESNFSKDESWFI